MLGPEGAPAFSPKHLGFGVETTDDELAVIVATTAFGIEEEQMQQLAKLAHKVGQPVDGETLQKPEERRQKTEVRGQRSEVRGLQADLSSVICHLSSVICHLSSVFCLLTSDLCSSSVNNLPRHVV